MIRTPRLTNGAEIYGVEITKLVEPVLRHHSTRLRKALAPPVKGSPLEGEAVAPARGLEYFLSGWYDFVSDAVSRYHCNLVSLGHFVLSLGCFAEDNRPGVPLLRTSMYGQEVCVPRKSEREIHEYQRGNSLARSSSICSAAALSCRLT